MRILIFAIIALIGGPFLTYEGYKSSEFNKRIAAEGVEVKGVPMSGESKKSGRRSRSYNITVMYPVKDAKPLTKEFKVTSSYYESVGKDGSFSVDTVPVKYLPSEPTTAIIVGGSDDDAMFLWIGPILTVIGLGVLVYRFRKKKAEPAA